jgi:1-acyl-sn-glycerol-3-phosphate acyltransferase
VIKIIKYPLWLLYRIWFYVLVALPILTMFPLLFLSVLKQKWHPFFFKLARIWAKCILIGMGHYWTVKRSEPLVKGQSYVFVANHTSMADIMLMLVVFKNHPFVFIGKKELVKIPIFGFFYKRTCILVDRSSAKSRQAVFMRAQKRIKQGSSICIFPEGGVPEESVVLDRFKAGAFRLAINHQVPLVPITFFDNKKRLSYTFFSGSPGKMRAQVHPTISTESLTIEDTGELSKKVFRLISNSLEADLKA